MRKSLSSSLWDLALRTCLWCQRCRVPIPVTFRRLVRRLLTRIPGGRVQTTVNVADQWPDPSGLDIRGSDSALLSTSSSPSPKIMNQPGSLACSIRHPFWPEPQRGLRCMVATGTLDLGGLEIVALFLARGLPSQGLDTVVAHVPSAGSDEPPAELLHLDGVPVVRVPRREIRQWLQTHRPDVISMHSPPDWFVVAASEAGVPAIETLHGAHNFFDRASWAGERRRSQQITGFIAVSDLVRRQYLRANPEYRPDNVVTIPNGVDHHHIKHPDRARAREWLGLRDEFLFVSLARYVLQKNTFGLVSAFADVARAQPEAHLLCAGAIVDQLYFEQVRRFRDGMPCAGQIHLRGPCPDVSTVLAAADAFVLDSFFEGWSLASMEALFAGLPVILSDVGGAREQLGEDRSRGYLVGNPLGDPAAMDWHNMGRAQFASQINRAALVEAMLAVVIDREHWADARQELKAEAMARFSAEVCLQRYAEVLTRAVPSGRRLSVPHATLQSRAPT